MKLIRIEGPAVSLVCSGCETYGVGGTEPYIASSSNDTRQPEEWYHNEDPLDFRAYCATCAAKLTEADPTRSVNQFYTDTAGTEIDPEVLQS